MKIGSRLLVAAGFAIAGLAGPARAADLPAVNLGMTSFLDGMPPAGAGWYGTQYLQYYTAGRVNDNAGNKVGLPKQDIDLFAGLSQLVYQSPLTFAGMHPGLDVILPWIASARTDDGIGNVALNARAGFGDL
ncbi:transporter, partial [Burkholderia cenocepacia]